MTVHDSGDGAGWDEASPDVDQPLGLSYRAFIHLKKALRKRIEFEHAAFGDLTVGGTHIPGGCNVLDVVDGTADVTDGWNDGTYTGGGLVWESLKGRLWVCSTLDTTYDGATDVTILKIHPDLQWAGGDITWTGAHEFDASVDISGNVAMDGDLTVDGKLIVDSSADLSDVYMAGDLSLAGSLKVATDFSLTGDVGVDGTANFFDEMDVSTLNVEDALTVSGGITGGVTLSGATVFNTTMTAANTFQDLDLSGTIGSKAAVVFLEIATQIKYAAKTKGYGSATFTNHYGTGKQYGGCAFEPAAGATRYAYMTLATDAGAAIQHGASNNTTTVTVKLIGYIT